MRTIMVVAATAFVAAVVAGRQDIARFIRIRQLSAGPAGHPEYVPAQGHHAYPD